MKDLRDKAVFEQRIAADRYNETLHRVFADWLEERGYDDEAATQRAWTQEKQEAEDYFEDFAKKHRINYLRLIADINRNIHNGHVCFSFDTPEIFQQQASRLLFLRHWKNLTGSKISKDKLARTIFSCAC